MEYIDLDMPLEVYRLRGNQREPISTTLWELLDFNKIPYTAVDVAPVRHGRWINRGWSTVCSECGEDYAFANRNYCPNCGALMDMEEQE